MVPESDYRCSDVAAILCVFCCVDLYHIQYVPFDPLTEFEIFGIFMLNQGMTMLVTKFQQIFKALVPLFIV